MYRDKHLYSVKRGIVLAVVMGVVLIISTLALVALYLGTSESRSVERKIRRMRAFYAAQGGMVYSLEQLSKGVDPSGSPALNIGGFSVNITYTDDDSGPGATDPVDVTVNY